MAHFAELDDDNAVLRVIVVGDDNTSDEEGNEVEAIGVAFLKELYGEDTNWVQTSYNTTEATHQYGGTPLRGNYASVGLTYDPVRDIFIFPQPYPSWVFSEEESCWRPPIPYERRKVWDEGTTSWVKTDSPHPSWVWDDDHGWVSPEPYPEDGIMYYWDEDSLSWIEV
jgi:hypothetical protein